MEFGSLDGKEGGEHNGNGVEKISRIFVTQGVFVFGKFSFNRVYCTCTINQQSTETISDDSPGLFYNQ